MLTADDIICYIPVYNDAEALERCLSKLQKMGIRGLVIDGRFTDFPKIRDSHLSTDGTRDVCRKYDAYYGICPPGREEDKLNMAFKLAKDYDYEVFMFCGADAYFEADMSEFLLSLQRFYEQYAVEPTQINVRTEELQPNAKWNNTATRQPRILLNYWKFEARHTHWTMFEKDTNPAVHLLPINEIIEGITLYHDNTIRPKERDDMMTKYQDGNVPRERKLCMKYLVKKAWDKINVMVWELGRDGTYEEARQVFFKKEGYTHIILAGEGYTVSQEQMLYFLAVLENRNNIMEAIDILSAVWKSPTHDNHITLNPTGEKTPDFSKYARIEALYSPKGIPDEGEAIFVIPFTAGPVICMSQKAMHLLDHIGDKLDFTALASGLGLTVFGDMRIQYD